MSANVNPDTRELDKAVAEHGAPIGIGDEIRFARSEVPTYARRMPLTGEYVPSTMDWVREQVETYEASNGREANTLRETGIPIIVVTTKGASSGNIRKFALMRVEHEGEYALVASIGGAPKNPSWYHNLVAEPLCEIQDGPEPFDYTTRIVEGDERELWWERSVAVFPTYADYAAKTDRTIPVFVATRV